MIDISFYYFRSKSRTCCFSTKNEIVEHFEIQGLGKVRSINIFFLLSLMYELEYWNFILLKCTIQSVMCQNSEVAVIYKVTGGTIFSSYESDIFGTFELIEAWEC